MNHTNQTLRRPETITNMEQLKQAQKKAEVNATQDKLRVASNLKNIKKEGPRLLLKDVILPVVGVGVAIYGISKLVGVLTDEDRGRDFYAEPKYEYEERDAPVHYATKPPRGPGLMSSLLTTSNLMRLAPIALAGAKMGVEYLEKNGTEVPDFVHSILDSNVGNEEIVG